MRIALMILVCAVAQAGAATYYVDAMDFRSSDKSAGTEAAPWRTISRAAGAKELEPGDTVLIKSGVYRESVHITVSGRSGRPITFAAAPGARVVIKGSEIVRGKWSKLSDDPDFKEKEEAARGVWRIGLGLELFRDPDFPDKYRNRFERWVSQVFIDDERALQRVGREPLYTFDGRPRLAVIGRGWEDLTEDSFYFDTEERELYIKILGDPSWYNIEIGVRGWVLTAKNVHDVVIRGLEMRQNRMLVRQWPMVGCLDSERVVFEDCRIWQADFCGLAVSRSKECVVRRCDLSHHGSTGLSLGNSQDCVVEDCWVMFNNYRRFHADWHAGGMKCIPANERCTVQRCEVAYNIDSDGIWFDSGNSEIRILDNKSHHNGQGGIFFEINHGGGIIANNLVYANRGRGIYVSGSRKTWVVHNTVAANGNGIVCMPREGDHRLEDVQVLNNLMIRNYVTQYDVNRGCDLVLYMGGDARAANLHSDYNVYANNGGKVFLRSDWAMNNTLDYWQRKFGQDKHSRAMTVEYDLMGTSFRLKSTEGLNAAGPLPDGLDWKPSKPSRVGCSLE